MSELNELKGMLTWTMIVTKDFDKILYYCAEKDIYNSDSRIIDKTDSRLIKHLSRKYKPISTKTTQICSYSEKTNEVGKGFKLNKD